MPIWLYAGNPPPTDAYTQNSDVAGVGNQQVTPLAKMVGHLRD